MIKNKDEIDSYLKDTNVKIIVDKINNKTLYNNFINNLDNYITYIKNKLKINNQEIKYIINLTLYNKNINKLITYKEYKTNINYFNNIFVKIFTYQYNQNIKFLKEYLNINKRDFNNLIKNINSHKKRTYAYFEVITKQNMSFYIPIIEYLETNS